MLFRILSGFFFFLLNLQDQEKELGCRKMQLESTAFDIQFFISEHAQDLSPNQSKQLLRLLNSTQRHFQEMQEKIRSQVDHFESLLQTAQVLIEQQVCFSPWPCAYYITR